jgi:NAD(P)H-dependent FMN reductase
MKTIALGCSASPDSMNFKGLKVLNTYCEFDTVDSLANYDIPVINTSASDGIVPTEVDRLITKLFEYDKFVFAVPEMTGQMGGAFKNFLDWLVVKGYMNANLGTAYPISKKDLVLLTFTPSGGEGGARHFPKTKEILVKLGANVVYTKCFNNGWKNLVPGNEELYKEDAEIIKRYLSYKKNTSSNWQQKYLDWLDKWNILKN